MRQPEIPSRRDVPNQGSFILRSCLPTASFHWKRPFASISSMNVIRFHRLRKQRNNVYVGYVIRLRIRERPYGDVKLAGGRHLQATGPNDGRVQVGTH